MRFRVRWLGYDRAAVDQFFAQFANDYDRLQANLTYLDQLIVKRDAHSALATAREQADAIRLAAERDSAAVIRQAEDRAAQLIQERLKTIQRDAERLTTLTRDVAPVLENALAVLRGTENGIHGRVLSEPEPPANFSGTLSPANMGGAGLAGRDRAARKWMAIVVGLIAVTIPVTAALYVRPKPVPTPPHPPTPAAPAPAVAIKPPPETAPTNRDFVRQAGSSSAVQPATEPRREDSAPSVRASTPQQGLTVLLIARSPCWVRATIDEGRTLEQLLKPGAEVTLNAQHDVLLRVGNAGAISMIVNGRPAEAFGRPGEVVTRRIARLKDGTIQLRGL